jgi:hypothetical protein
MPQQILCASCSKPLRIADELLGRTVRCPHCQTKFTAALPSQADGIQAEEPRPAPRELPAGDELDDDDHPRRRSRRKEAQLLRSEKRRDKGPAVMLLGIGSIVSTLIGILGFCLCGAIGMMAFGAVGVALGIPAWLMGQFDLAAMRRGEMTWDGEYSTKAGWVCGIAGTILGVLAMLVGCGLLLAVLGLLAGMGGRR